MYEIEKLKNGMELLRVPMTGVESISTVVMVKTGSRYEELSSYGVAHFLEHMVFKGTKKFPNTKIISERIDSIGAQFNAFTSEEMTAFYIRSASKDIDISIEMLGQLTTQTLLNEEEIEREKGVILEEMHMYEDQPAQYNMILFNEMFYKGSGLAHSVLGTKEVIKNMKRAQFLEYIKNWYKPQNMLIVVAGKKEAVMDKNLEGKIENNFIFAAGANKKGKDQSSFWEKDFKYGPKLNIEKRKIEQIHFLMAWPGLDYFDEREETLNLLTTILGGNMSSRLFLQVRERRGLCYYISAQNDSFADVGCLAAMAGVNPEKIGEALKVTKQEFEKLSEGKESIKEKELIKAKNYMSGHLTLAQESVHNLAISYGMKYLMTGKITTVKERLAEIQKVDLAAVKKIAAELIEPDKMRLAVIGNLNDSQEEEIFKLW